MSDDEQANAHELSDQELAELFGDDQPATRGQWGVNSLEDADWALRRIGELRQEAGENALLAQVSIDRVNARLEALNVRTQRGLDFFEGHLRRYVEEHRAELLKGKKRSRQLLHGSVGFRRVGAGLKVLDEAAFLEWARRQPMELGVLRIEERPALNVIKKYAADTGEVPDGATIAEGQDEFVAKPLSIETTGESNGDD